MTFDFRTIRSLSSGEVGLRFVKRLLTIFGIGLLTFIVVWVFNGTQQLDLSVSLPVFLALVVAAIGFALQRWRLAHFQLENNPNYVRLMKKIDVNEYITLEKAAKSDNDYHILLLSLQAEIEKQLSILLKAGLPTHKFVQYTGALNNYVEKAASEENFASEVGAKRISKREFVVLAYARLHSLSRLQLLSLSLKAAVQRSLDRNLRQEQFLDLLDKKMRLLIDNGENKEIKHPQ